MEKNYLQNKSIAKRVYLIWKTKSRIIHEFLIQFVASFLNSLSSTVPKHNITWRDTMYVCTHPKKSSFPCTHPKKWRRHIVTESHDGRHNLAISSPKSKAYNTQIPKKNYISSAMHPQCCIARNIFQNPIRLIMLFGWNLSFDISYRTKPLGRSYKG